MIDIKDKYKALKAFMDFYVSENSKISIEGYELVQDFGSFEKATAEASDTLPRQTIWPKLNFFIIPLTSGSSDDIFHQIQVKELLHYQEGIIHVQIEKDGERVFIGCDNLDPESTRASGLSASYLNLLTENGTIHGFEETAT